MRNANMANGGVRDGGGREGKTRDSKNREGKKTAVADIFTGAGAQRLDISDVRKRVLGWKDIVARETVERPERTLALAATAGFLVGGGIFSRLTARLLGLGLKIGLRMAVIPMVTQGLAAFGENLFRDGAPADAENVGDTATDTRVDARSESKKQLRNTDPKETQSP
jgi:hypothetical protein